MKAIVNEFYKRVTHSVMTGGGYLGIQIILMNTVTSE
jgi:hypothetical protein